MIYIRNLSFGYSKDAKIFNGLDFSLEKGEKIGLVGPNGAGKTTLFHLIMGLLRPDSGEIRVFGRLRKSEKDFSEVRRRIGLLFQDSEDQLFCPTVEEDIAFGPLNLGMSHSEAKAVVQETCGRLGLNGLQKKVIHRLSGGEKRLVALASVVAMNPECYLLDEPTAGLDTRTTARFLRYLREYADTYIIITHNREVLKNAADRIYGLREGRMEPFSL